MTSEKSVLEACESVDSATVTGSNDRSLQARPTSSMERTTTKTSVVAAIGTKEAAIAAAKAAIERWRISGTAKGVFDAGEGEVEDEDELNIDDFNRKPHRNTGRWFYDTNDKAEVAKLYRQSNKKQVQWITRQYLFDKNNEEQRYCVWDDDACYWPEKSSGITWVGVHGVDSVCVVTRKGDLDTMRLGGNLKPSTDDWVLSMFRKSIICEIEDFGDPSSELRQKFQKCIKKPFGVVSANPGTNNIKASDYDEKKAIEFLREKMKRDTDFNVYETMETAIGAFQHLCRKKLKAGEIEVSVMDPDCVYVVTEKKRDSNVEELSVDQIEKYLDHTVGECGLSEVDIPMQDVGNLQKEQKTSHETYLPSPGGSSNISEIEKCLDDTIGESGLSEMDIPMMPIDDVGHLLKKQKTSHEINLPSPGGSSNSETMD